MRASDLEVFYEHQRDPEAVQMAAFEPRARRAFMAHWRRLLADGSVVKRTLVCGDRVAGYVVCWQQSGEWRVGYWIGREHWGRGLATLALRGLLELVRERPLVAWVASHNRGSVRVLEKCGFVPSELGAAAAGDRLPEGVEELRMVLSGAAPASGRGPADSPRGRGVR